MELVFRKLKASEIEARVGQVNKGGVKILLYKDARCDQSILDETVGPMNWQKKYSNNNKNCTISIYDPEKKCWVEKEDVGAEPTQNFGKEAADKGLASDSQKRAGFAWGIGRALYSASKLNLFFFSSEIKGWSTKKDQDGKDQYYCISSFRVRDIEYNDDADTIRNVTIEEVLNGKVTAAKKFPVSEPENVTPAEKPQTSQTQTSAPAATPAPAHAPSSQNGKTALIAEDEVILIGNCRGKKYAEAKNTQQFASFMNWIKTATTRYVDPKQADQFERLKKLAAS